MYWFTAVRALVTQIVGLDGYALRLDGQGRDDDVCVMTGGEFLRYADDETRDVVVLAYCGDDAEEPQSTGSVDQDRGPISPQRPRNENGTVGVLIRCKSRGDGDPGAALEQIVADLEAMLRADPKAGLDDQAIVFEVLGYAEPMIDVGDPAYTQLGMNIGYQAYPR